MEDLWKEWKESPSDELRKKIILNYTNLVHYVIHNSKFINNNIFEHNDYFEFGIEGLSEAIDRFDPDFGTKFETYAIQRIRGKIIDELRKAQIKPRLPNNQEAKIEYTNVDKDYIPSDFSVIEETENTEAKEALINAIKSLSERDRMVITLYYFEHLSYKEISEVLDISVSRISQIHTNIISQLKKELEKFD